MKNKKKIDVLLFLIIVFVSLISRFIYIFFFDYSLSGHNSVLSALFDNSSQFKNGISPTSIYIFLVNNLYRITGSKELACLALNILLQISSIIIIYFAFKNFTSIYSAFSASMIFSLWPWYSKKIFEVSSYNLIHLIRSIIILLISLLYLFVHYKIAKRSNKIIKDGGENMTNVTEVSEKNNNNTPAGMKELTSSVNYIENPLPVPKRREHKAMEYAIELNSQNDFFDIEDMTGMDFFDIE